MGKVSKSVGKVSRPGQRFYVRRTLYSPDPAEIKKHNARVGAVIHAYNTAHSSVCLAFLNASSGDSHNDSPGLWFSFGSDSAQREFAKTYFAKNNFIKGPIRRALTWSITSLNELATLRNDIAHSDMIWTYEGLQAGFLAKPGTRLRLEERPFESTWKDLQGDLSALSNYIQDLAWDLALRNTWPSSKRPRLKLARFEETKRQERNRQAKRKARQRPPQS